MAGVLTHSRLEASCAVVAVTLASDSSVRRERAGQIFKAWRNLLSRILVEVAIGRGDPAGNRKVRMLRSRVKSGNTASRSRLSPSVLVRA